LNITEQLTEVGKFQVAKRTEILPIWVSECNEVNRLIAVILPERQRERSVVEVSETNEEVKFSLFYKFLRSRQYFRVGGGKSFDSFLFFT